MKRANIVIEGAERIPHDQFVELVTQVTVHLQGQAKRYFPDGALAVTATMEPPPAPQPRE